MSRKLKKISEIFEFSIDFYARVVYNNKMHYNRYLCRKERPAGRRNALKAAAGRLSEAQIRNNISLNGVICQWSKSPTRSSETI